MKTFSSFLGLSTPNLRAKLLCALPKIVYALKARNTGSGPTTGIMLTKLTKSPQPNKLTVSIMPPLLSLAAMPTDLACNAYTWPILQAKNNF